MEKENY